MSYHEIIDERWNKAQMIEVLREICRKADACFRPEEMDMEPVYLMQIYTEARNLSRFLEQDWVVICAKTEPGNEGFAPLLQSFLGEKNND